MTTYSIGYARHRTLRPLARGEDESAAIDRLDRGTGSAEDMRLAAEIYRRSGREDDALELLRMVEGPCPT